MIHDGNLADQLLWQTVRYFTICQTYDLRLFRHKVGDGCGQVLGQSYPIAEVMVRSSFYIDCSPGSMGIPQYEAGVPSWAPPAKCPLDQNPSLVDGGAAKNCRPHQEECRRIHKALESKILQPSVMFCPLQDMVFIHYNDAQLEHVPLTHCAFCSCYTASPSQCAGNVRNM